MCGTIDCLFQDDRGRWGLVDWVTEPAPARQAGSAERELRLALAAEAIRQQTGGWPHCVVLAFVRDGEVVERAGSQLARRGLLKRAAGALAGMMQSGVR